MFSRYSYFCYALNVCNNKTKNKGVYTLPVTVVKLFVKYASSNFVNVVIKLH